MEMHDSFLPYSFFLTGLLVTLLGCLPSTDVGPSPIGEDTFNPTEPTETVKASKRVARETTAVDRSAAWPNWMGPNHSGVSQEANWAADWPPEGLSVVWDKQIGIGFSSVSIADGQLFTMGHVQGREFVYCLDISNGEIIWQHSYPCQLVDVLHEGGPAATPTIDSDYLYTLGREGQLFCFRTDSGETVWKTFLQEDLNVSLPEWGFASSVFILGDQLILQGGRVVSYNKLTGKRNWQTTPHAAGYGSAIAFTHDDRVLLATLDCDGLRITQSDGEEIAFAAWDSPYGTNSTTPIINDDTIYVSSGYDVGCGLFQLQGNSLELIYSNREMRNHFNNSVLYKGYLYGFDGNSNWDRRVSLTCMHFETGEVAWKQGGLGCGSLMVADGKLLILAENGSLVVAQATPEHYQELTRSVFLEGRCWTVPVLLNQRIYGRNAAGKLVCAQCKP